MSSFFVEPLCSQLMQTGYSYESLNIFHRTSERLIVLLTIIHVAGRSKSISILCDPSSSCVQSTSTNHPSTHEEEVRHTSSTESLRSPLSSSWQSDQLDLSETPTIPSSSSRTSGVCLSSLSVYGYIDPRWAIGSRLASLSTS